jgi:orotate phosphoribosyltransferase
MLSSLAAGYAALIASSLSTSEFPQFDILFGPAYKGISLAACTALVLHRDYSIDVGFGYDRKEAKDHGEGGMMVGAPVQGKKILVLDDVMTAGTAARGAVDMVRRAGGDVVGVVLCLDRDEIDKEGKSSVQEMEEYVGGKGRVKAILRMKDLMAWLEEKGRNEELQLMQTYWQEFGVKE